MRSVEQYISPLVENLFPSFYKDEGQDFIAFVKAYYEWLEQNFQLLTVDSTDGFDEGDTITQVQIGEDIVTGTIYSIDDNTMLVKLDDLAPFRCIQYCDMLTPIYGKNNASTYLQTAVKLNPIFHARNLFKYRDIDDTIDSFILQFKEKYLKNIQFNTATNKELLVKNSLSLYRAKGTERAVDLFFKLVYGTAAEVYYPGDDIFRLSDGNWYVPRYIEVTHTSRSVDYVGKLITGMSSGATAFVEKFVKIKTETGFVHAFFITDIKGNFQTGEALKTSRTYTDAPKVLGSLTTLSVLTGGSNYSVGDVVDVISDYGSSAKARVTGIEDTTGQIEFIFNDGGFGYSASPVKYLSDKTLTIDSIIATDTRYFYDLELIKQNLINVNFSSTTTDTFAYSSNVYSYHANGDVRGIGRVIDSNFATIVTASVNTAANATTLITLSSGNTDSIVQGYLVTGASNTGVINTAISSNVTSIINSTAFVVNADITVANGTTEIAVSGNGYVGELLINITTGEFPNTTVLYTAANAEIASINAVYDRTVTGRIIRPLANLTFSVTGAEDSFAVGAEVYQSNGTTEVANGIIAGAFLTGGTGALDISNYRGVFSNNYVLSLRSSVDTCNIDTITTQIAVEYVTEQSVVATINASANSTTLITLTTGNTHSMNIGDEITLSSNLQVVNTNVSSTIAGIVNSTAFYASANVIVANGTTTITITDLTNVEFIAQNVYCNAQTSNTSFLIDSISLGSGADYTIVGVDITDNITVNTDYVGGNNVSEIPYLSVALNATEFGFPKDQTANIDSYIMEALTFEQLAVGSIQEVITADPGSDYNYAPVPLIDEPLVSTLNLQDFILNIQSVPGVMLPGEIITQNAGSTNTVILTLNVTPTFYVGEIVYDGANLSSSTANGIVYSINTTANTMQLIGVLGTFANGNTINSYVTSTSANVIATPVTNSIVQIAKGEIVEVDNISGNNSTLYVRRLSVTDFVVSGNVINDEADIQTANIISVFANTLTLPIGRNANVETNVVTAPGAVTTLQVIDSGFGYSDNSAVTFVGSNSQASGTATTNVDNVGQGEGYYRDTRGFVSDNKYIHDSDFYQEYSYQVLTRLSFDKYSDIFKKVMHVSGTKLFGAVVIQDVGNISLAATDSEIVEE